MMPPAAITLLLLVASFKYDRSGAFAENRQKKTQNAERESTKNSQDSLLLAKAISQE